MIFAAAESTNWPAVLILALLSVWLFSNIVLTFSQWRQEWRKKSVIDRLEMLARRLEEEARRAADDKVEASNDRKLMQKILSVISGWILTFEKKEERQQEQLQQVAVQAHQKVEELKQTIETVSDKMISKIDEKVGDSTILRPPKPSS